MALWSRILSIGQLEAEQSIFLRNGNDGSHFDQHLLHFLVHSSREKSYLEVG